MKRIFVKILLFFICLAITFTLVQFVPAENTYPEEFRLPSTRTEPAFLGSPAAWVDSVMQSLSLEEKIAQMLMIAAYSNSTKNNKKHEEETEKIIRNYNIGGLIFFQGTPVYQAKLTNRYQKISKTPLFIAMDAEWGLAMRLDSSIRYPRQMMLGAIQNEKLIYDMGSQIAWQLKRIGVHINFAPVADINNNAYNPVINSRSFGEDRANVTRKSILYMLGMQDNGIIAVAKHFPGHGDTEIDSHLDLPVIKHNRSRIDSIELFPFKELIYSGISGVMTGHLNVPVLDSSNKVPASLSAAITDTLLKQEMGFKGLVFTDAMNMKGITNYVNPDTAVMKAFLAGNDIILMPADVQNAIKTIKQLIENGTVSADEVDKRCRKILLAKYWAGLNKYQPVELKGLISDLNQPCFELLSRKLIENSLTIVINDGQIMPLQHLDTLKIGSIAMGNAESYDFQQSLRLYAKVDTFHFSINKYNNSDSLFAFASHYNMLVVSVHTDDLRATRNFGIPDTIFTLIDSLCLQKNVILNLFGSPYLLNKMQRLNRLKGLVISYENYMPVQQLSAQLIFGAIPGHAILPVSLSTEYSQGYGISIRDIGRLKYGTPLESDINPAVENGIDSIVSDAINREVMPGCQILAAKNGIVFLHKAYGKPTYRSKQNVKLEDLYDLASVTKVVATVPAIMKLYEEEVVDISKPLSNYLTYLDTTNKKDITIKDILLHKAGLLSWIPFYINTMEPVYPSQNLFSSSLSSAYPFKINGGQYLNRYTCFKKGFYSTKQSPDFPYQVANGIFASKSIHDSIMLAICNSPVEKKARYRYSDLGFILMYKMIEKVTGQTFEEYLNNSFYKRIGTTTLCFNPLRSFSSDQIIPTEEDQYFRKQNIHGYVHDPAAAMLGGISGHAGLFSNANDLGKIMQMFLNEGVYGGDQFFNNETVAYFTSRQSKSDDNRRGLGFDKPETDRNRKSPACQSVSPESYGHSGFTGTYVWVDPSCQLVYVFLSNRIYPDASNNKLVDMNIRTKIQQELYNNFIHL
jgi:beta-glucosidase-like glycosyl hydrolase/CubicO group peptidase (beta-lactamase class C family)